MNLDELRNIFFQECEEGLGQAEVGLLALQDGTGDAETINTIFRAVHSIKGGSGAFALSALQTFTHHFETVLDQARSGEKAVNSEVVALLLSAFDVLADHVAAARGEAGTPDDGPILARLQNFAAAQHDVAAEATTAHMPDDLGFDLAALIGTIAPPEMPGEDWQKPVMVDSPVPETARAVLTVRPLDAALTNGGEPILLVRELLELGLSIRAVDISAIPAIDRFDPASSYLSWSFDVPDDVSRSSIDDIFEFVSDCCEVRLEGGQPPATAAADEPASPGPDRAVADAAPPPPPKDLAVTASTETDVAAPSAAAGAEARPGTAVPAMMATIRVDLEKLDRLVDLVGELVITQSMLSQRLHDRGLDQIDELADLDHLTRELQDSAMSIRAQPIRSVFGRVPRIVRELEASTGKRVRLELDGEGTELDKTVIERIGEPLTHLIRNAVDHGLELPEERLATGKTAEGHIRLAAEHRSGRILISVSDDGRGIDRARVLAKAVDRGLVAADAKLSNEEIDQLIFAPGFSTAQAVSNISGRGVGMDVVRRNIGSLGGRISIASHPGKGSVFTMALPLTLAILDGMIVSIADQTFVVPLNHIVETLRPQADVVKSFGHANKMLNVRGQWLPIIPVGSQLRVPGGRSDPTAAVLIVVETEETGRGVLMVDEIVDQRQVVIKSLETNYGRVDGIAGATILGDGRVALILDVEAITTTRNRVIEAAGRTGRDLAA